MHEQRRNWRDWEADERRRAGDPPVEGLRPGGYYGNDPELGGAGAPAPRYGDTWRGEQRAWAAPTYGDAPRPHRSPPQDFGYGGSMGGGAAGAASGMGASWGFGAQGFGEQDFGESMEGSHAGKGPKGWRRPDERILEEVCERLRAHGEVDASEMEVDVQDGEVTLEGVAPDRRTKRLAEDCCDEVPGVVDVANRLRVRRESTERAQAEPGGAEPGPREGARDGAGRSMGRAHG